MARRVLQSAPALPLSVLVAAIAAVAIWAVAARGGPARAYPPTGKNAAAVPSPARALGRRPAATRAPRHRTVAVAPVRLPLVKQALRNNCETAALSMLLAGAGVRVSQLELQRRLSKSGPLDPVPGRSGRLPLWGDPTRGFVGRAAGGGPSGGFGVYQGPIRRLALRYGVTLRDLTGDTPAAVYRQLRLRHPVMVWVGLSPGPYRSWRTPTGRRITVNLGEHTVVLTGLRDNDVQLNDPLTGRSESWTRTKFVLLWHRLGRRALGVASKG